MPPSSEIVARLTALATAGAPVAIFWHLVFLMAATAAVGGWRPYRRNAARLVALLVASPAVVAALDGNVFNAAVLGALAIALAVLAQWVPRERIGPAPLASLVPGLLMLGAGVFYPHFVEGSTLRVVFASPLGVLPCPTLYAAIGLALAGNIGRAAWADTLAAAALFYGVFGVARLGVHFDLGLIAGALVLIASRFLYRRAGHGPRTAS